MTTLAEEILKNFDRLPNPEQVEIALEILRRLANTVLPKGADIVDLDTGHPGNKSDINLFRKNQDKFHHKHWL